MVYFHTMQRTPAIDFMIVNRVYNAHVEIPENADRSDPVAASVCGHGVHL